MSEVVKAAPAADEHLIAPPPPNLFQMLTWLGPGLILVGSIVGSGELVATPLAGATAGYGLLWLILLSCVIKVFFQIEIGRYAISTGQPSLEAFNEVALPIRLGGRIYLFNWLGWYWFLMVLACILQQGAMVGGCAQALRLAFPDAFGAHTETVFAILAGVSASVLLIGGQYRVVEGGTIILVALFTMLTIYTVVSLQFTTYATSAQDLLGGFSFTLPTDPVHRQAALAAGLTMFGITGVGASELIAYPYWCLEKGYAQRIGRRDGSEGWVTRARGWIRVMMVDAWFSMVIFTTATLAFYILAAEIMHPAYLKGVPLPSGSEMIERLEVMYAQTFGGWSRIIYLVGAVAVLYSTLFVSTAGHSRMMADWLGLLRIYDRKDAEKRRLAIAIFCVLFPQIATIAYLATKQPILLIMISGIMQALMLPMLGAAILFLSYRRTDRRIRGGIFWYIMLWTALILTTLASTYLVYDSLVKYVRG